MTTLKWEDSIIKFFREEKKKTKFTADSAQALNKTMLSL